MDDELPILGEPVAIELANTWYGEGERDFLADADVGGRWVRAAVPEPPPEVSAAEVHLLRTLRDAVRTLLDPAGTADDPAAIAVVNDHAAAACAHPALDRGTAQVRYRGAPLACARARLAASCIELVAARAPVRRCEGPGCAMWFVQHHAHRRFCHDGCSHRARQARYRSRR
ncbi:MAG: CGNR zinc finger domain-containing protein [Myxococcota bacterium]